MKNRHALSFVLAATLLSMSVITVDIPFVGAIVWSSEMQLTTDPYQDLSPAIMQAGDGTIWVVWVSNRFGNDELLYKTSPNYGLNWSPYKRLTYSSGNDECPSIMQAADGRIWVVWDREVEGNYDIVYTTSDDGGLSWSPAANLTDYPGWDSNPAIMQAADGRIWVVWDREVEGNYDIVYTTSDDGGLSWSYPATPLTTDSSRDKGPSIMQARDGTIWVVWTSNRTGNYELHYKTFDGTTWFSHPDPLTEDPNFDTAPSIAQARNGTIWVVWQSDRSPKGLHDLYYKVSEDNGLNWSDDEQLTYNPDESDGVPSIAQTNDRKIWVVWTADRDEDFDIYYKTTVVIPGDVNGDGTVDITDLALVGEAYGTVKGDPNYDPNADLNCDEVIDVYDLVECGKNWGKS